VYAKECARSCTILADDLSAELDKAHTGMLLEALVATGAQVFLTVTDAALLENILDIPHALFHVEQGDLKG
jgi:recombinational DNA repair ATPase RecF